MKIIKRGDDPKEVTLRDTCRSCHTIFEYGRKEAEYVPDQRDGDFLKIKCPVCQTLCFRSVK